MLIGMPMVRSGAFTGAAGEFKFQFSIATYVILVVPSVMGCLSTVSLEFCGSNRLGAEQEDEGTFPVPNY